MSLYMLGEKKISWLPHYMGQNIPWRTDRHSPVKKFRCYLDEACLSLPVYTSKMVGIHVSMSAQIDTRHNPNSDEKISIGSLEEI